MFKVQRHFPMCLRKVWRNETIRTIGSLQYPTRALRSHAEGDFSRPLMCSFRSRIDHPQWTERETAVRCLSRLLIAVQCWLTPKTLLTLRSKGQTLRGKWCGISQLLFVVQRANFRLVKIFTGFLSQLCTNVLSKPPISHFKSNSDDINVTRLRLCVVALYTFCAHTELFFSTRYEFTLADVNLTGNYWTLARRCL